MTESAHREEVQHLTESCSRNNLNLNTLKTKGQTGDFRRSNHSEQSALYLYGEVVERVEAFKFLNVQISANLSR